jgi:BirA family transcriptional regulator, biotin operon repressor / biotin---[acetyl-CoA-carboxylase] ligase
VGVRSEPPTSSLVRTLAALLPGRPLRVYPAALSVEADALAWARAGAAAGSVVTADYQVAPRGRGGLEWEVRPDRDAAFSVVVRPELSEAREGWLYSVATAALSDLDEGATIRWPDEVRRGGVMRARVGVQAEAEDGVVSWAVISVLRRDVERAPAIAQALAAIERRLGQDPLEVLDVIRSRVSTVGRGVRARMVPMGPSGVVHEGEAIGVRDDGGLAIRTAGGSLLRIVPQAVGLIDEFTREPIGDEPFRDER